MNTVDMQAKVHALGKQRAEIRAKSDTLRAELEAIEAEFSSKRAALKQMLRGIEAPLYDIDKERGMICRALQGKTGEPT
jgi:predicted  nucleic acid-binding Zn-ribbon protein